MNEINNLFICSKCGNSIAPQMDNLDIAETELNNVIKVIELAVNRLQEIKKTLIDKCKATANNSDFKTAKPKLKHS